MKFYSRKLKPLLRHAYGTEHGDNWKEKNEVGIVYTLKNLLTKSEPIAK